MAGPRMDGEANEAGKREQDQPAMLMAVASTIVD
jgi:hypothetical protein